MTRGIKFRWYNAKHKNGSTDSILKIDEIDI